MENQILRSGLLLFVGAFAHFQSTSAVTALQRADFFEQLTGVAEPDYVANQGHLLREVVHDGRIHNTKTKTSLSAGVFHAYSIAQLNDLIKNKKPSQHRGIFNVVVGYNTKHMSLERRAKLDIGALQAAPENKDALFQVDSNFDCRGSVSSVVEGRRWMSDYVYAMRQGQLAAVSAAPGLFLRCYPARPINLLRNFPFLLPPRHGYLVLDLANRAVLERAANLDHEQVMVGVHQNIDVAYGQLLNANEHLICKDKDQMISQVFVSALDLGLACGNELCNQLGDEKVREQVEAVAKKLLLAAYEGTIKAAIAFDKQKVFLTVVGYDVFNNKLAWVQEAIENCIEDIGKFGLDVTLVVYDANTRKDMTPFLAGMKKIVNSTDGEYEELYEAFGSMTSGYRGRLQ